MLEEQQGRTEVREESADLEERVDGGGGAAPAGIEEVDTGNAAGETGIPSESPALGNHETGAAEQIEPPVFVTPVLDDEGENEGSDAEGGESAGESTQPWSDGVRVPRLQGPRRGRRLVKKRKSQADRKSFTGDQRLLMLDTWQRSGLPGGDFAALVGVSKHTLYSWKKKFEEHGPAGLTDRPRGSRRGSRLPEVTKRSILMIKKSSPEYGVQRISDMLLRGPSLPASPSAVARVLHEAGYELDHVPTKRHPDKVRRFERATPNQLWQTDIFTFVLKRQNRRVHLVAFMDDHSRYITGYGLHASASGALVLEVLRAGIASYGTPEEILTDNGSQYITWRGKSAFAKECEKRGINQLVAKPRRPQTLGKIERFWGTLWRECVESSVFLDLGDARRRIGLFIDYYNLQRTHQGIGGLVPADRFFSAAPNMLATMKKQMATNALELARNGTPKEPFYLAGNVGGKPVSVYSEGERLVLKQGNDEAKEIELVSPKVRESAKLPEHVCPAGVVGEETASTPGYEEPPAPGTSPLDAGLEALSKAFGDAPEDATSQEQDGGVR